MNYSRPNKSKPREPKAPVTQAALQEGWPVVVYATLGSLFLAQWARVLF
jgi:hypothetical protein